MSDDQKSFKVCGLLLPTLESPCIGTPVFERIDGSKYYIQILTEDNNSIVDFVPFKKSIGPDLFVEVRTNKWSDSGDEATFGYFLDGQNVRVGNREIVSDYIMQNCGILARFPHSYFDAAAFTGIPFVMFDAMAGVRESLRKGEIILHSYDEQRNFVLSNAALLLLDYQMKGGTSFNACCASIGVRKRNFKRCRQIYDIYKSERGELSSRLKRENSDIDDAKPKKYGWWQRRGFF